MYWTDWGSVPKIEVANYDGSNRHMIITSGLRLPNAIALDATGQTIYWADAGTTQIEKANVDGSNRQTLYTNTSSHFYGLALSGQYLYYTDWNAHSIMRLSVAGGAATEFGKAAFGRLNDVYAVSAETSSTGSNACTNNHAGCQHICLPLGNNGRTCVCQEGYTLQSDGTSCSSGKIFWETQYTHNLLSLKRFEYACYTSGLSVRLAGANSTSRGRIEVSLDHGSTWGSVCDDRFDQSDANVICGMLGFSRSNAIPKNSSFFGPAETSYPILLDDIFCTGNEASILECSHSPLGLTDCDHNEDAGVICATEGQVYLSGSTSSNQGRIEIFLNGRWGTICDDNFGQTEANVVCGMLGFPRNGSVAKGSAYFGAGVQSESVHLDNVGCSGLETSVVNCAHSQVDTNNCGHREDVGVICPSLYPAQVRLTGGVTPTAGRVEISVDNGVTWGTICDDSFQTAEAGVVNFLHNRQGAITTSRFGSGSSSMKILLDDVNCRGSETNIIDCQHSAVGVNNCGHSEDIGVSCLSTSMSDVQIHLANGSSSREGRVEISVDAGTTWGTVCDDGFGNTEAGVVCVMLGYERGSAITKSISYFGKGSTSQHILLDDVDCVGSEANILACRHSPIGVNDCGHSEDVGVSCLNANNFRVRLVSRSTSHEGRVEVSDDSGVTWGTVCDDGFGDTDAGVVCNMLGYSRTGAVAQGATVYGPGSSSSPILLDDVDCTSADTSIFFCRHNGIGVENCGHHEDVGVQCPSACQYTSYDFVRVILLEIGLGIHLTVKLYSLRV
ncbi:DMBT1-like protein, partial [Mya arenaria]